MGRILKKFLIGSGLALGVFIVTVFLFGSQNTFSLEAPSFLKSPAKTAKADPAAPPKNLTDTISDTLSERLLQENPDTFDISNQQKFVSEALAAEAGQFNPDDLIEPVDETRVSILPENTQEGRQAYVDGLIKILTNDLKGQSSETSGDPAGMFSQLAQERASALGKIYGLQPTPDLADLHRDILVLVGTQQNVFKAIADYEADPIKAILAAKFQTSIETSIKDIAGRLDAYAIAHNLTS